MEFAGYVKIHRRLLDNPISKKPNYAWLWTTLLLLANHKPTKIMWNGELIIINEGQLLTGRKQLSEKTGISQTTIEDILKFLERQHQIRQQKTTKFRIITILNWNKYQNPDTKSDNKPTTSRQQADTNKNDKNERRDSVATLHQQVQDLFSYYKREFLAKISSEPPTFAWAKCEKLAKPHLTALGLVRMKQMIDFYLNSNDPFYRKINWSLEVFLASTTINSLKPKTYGKS